MTEKLEGLIAFLDKPERLDKLTPKQLLNMIPIKGDENIIDIGAGTGYLTIPAASKTKGTVYAYDMEPKLLSIIKERAEVQKITNIEYIEGRIEELPSFTKPIQVVLASLILHEIKVLPLALGKIYNTLADNGYLICVEYEIEEYISVKPPRVSSKMMIDELEKANFLVKKKLLPAEDLYIIFAKKI